jgi:ribonucleotide reductase alpha subunit
MAYRIVDIQKEFGNGSQSLSSSQRLGKPAGVSSTNAFKVGSVSLIKKNLSRLAYEMPTYTKLDENLDLDILSQAIYSYIKGPTTYMEVANMSANFCKNAEFNNPDYERLASRLLIDGLDATCSTDVSQNIKSVYYNYNSKLMRYTHGIRTDTLLLVENNKQELQDCLRHEFNDKLNFFGLQVMLKSYLLRSVNDDSVLESPQCCYMRVASDIMGYDNPDIKQGVEGIKKAYTLIASHKLVPPSPHFFGFSQFASCFLTEIGEDTLYAITKANQELSIISQKGGGVGITLDRLRGSKSVISSSGGKSSGLPGFASTVDQAHDLTLFNSDPVPNDYSITDNDIGLVESMEPQSGGFTTSGICKSYAATANYVDQGGGKRKGSFAIYMSSHHDDFIKTIKLKDPTLPDDIRTLDLFYCAWNSDLFMKRVRNNEMWSLFSPNMAPGLHTLWGTHFEALYEFYESKKLYSSQIKAKELYKIMVECIIGFSACYVMWKDACNRYCNESEDIPSGYGTKDHIEYWLQKEREHEDLCNQAKKRNNNVFETDLPEMTVAESDIKLQNKNSYYIDKLITTEDKKSINLRIQELEKLYPEESHRIIGGKRIEIRQGGYCNIKLSNLCTEILTKIDNKSKEDAEIGVCNICSVNLSEHVKEDGSFDFEELYNTAYFAVIYMNRAIDRTRHPLPSIMNYSSKRRPLGIGTVGFATACTKLGLSIYEDVDKVDILNYKVWETMYYATMKASMELAKKYNRTYLTFESSPLAKGLFCFDLYNTKFDNYKEKIEKLIATSLLTQPSQELDKYIPKNNWDFEELRGEIARHGVYNSQTLSQPPNASSASLLGVSENTEPYSSLALIRNTLSGSFVVINPLLVKKLRDNGLWTNKIYHRIIQEKGHIQNISEIPQSIRRLFPTLWEHTGNLKRLCDLYIGRQWFISNAQSFNLHGYHTDRSIIKSLIYMWENGAKNGVYYYRVKKAEATTQFSLESHQKNNNNSSEMDNVNTLSVTQDKNSKKSKSLGTNCTDDVCISCT